MPLHEPSGEPPRILTIPVQDLPPRPGVPFFEGTVIPELTVEHDTEWLGALVSENVIVNGGFVGKLNADVNGCQGLTIAQRQIQAENKVPTVVGSSVIKLSPADWAGICRRHFYKLMLGGGEPERPARTGIDSAAIQETRPLRVIEIARVLGHVVGAENLDEISRRGRDLFRSSNNRLFHSMNVLLGGGLDLRAVILGSPGTIMARASANDEELLVNGRRAEEKYKRALAKLEKGTAKIKVPKVKSADERVIPDMENAARYQELAKATGLDAVALHAAYPEADLFSDDTFARVRRTVSNMADTISIDRDMRLRDLDFLKSYGDGE